MLKPIDGVGSSPARPSPRAVRHGEGSATAPQRPQPCVPLSSAPHILPGGSEGGPGPSASPPRCRSVTAPRAGGRAGGREPRSGIRAVCSGIRALFSHGTAQEPRSASLSSPGLRLCFKGLGRLGLGGCCGMRGCFASATQQTGTEPKAGLGGAPEVPQNCAPVSESCWSLTGPCPGCQGHAQSCRRHTLPNLPTQRGWDSAPLEGSSPLGRI